MTTPLIVRLTNYDAGGSRWTPCHTVQVTTLPGGQRLVADCLSDYRETVRTVAQARAVAGWILGCRTRLDWTDWRPVGTGGTVRECAAEHPQVGPIRAWVHTLQDPQARGMYSVGFTFNGWSAAWLSGLHHTPHRMEMVRARAIHRADTYHSEVTPL